MSYKNPEHKRQWEREHREHRNAQRRNRRVTASGDSSVRKPSSQDKWGSPWGVIFGCAAAVGVVLLAAFGGKK